MSVREERAMAGGEAGVGVAEWYAVRESKGLWWEAWERFRRDKLALAGGAIIILLVVLALGASLFSQYVTHYAPYEQDLRSNLKRPGFQKAPEEPRHWLGTDELGRDVLTRAIYAARISLGVSGATVLIALTVGTLMGTLSGFYGGVLDAVIMRFVDIMLSIPAFFLLLFIAVVFSPGIVAFSFVIASVSWMGVSRLVRGEFLSIKARDYVDAARVVGASNARIIFRHILPNATTPLIVAATLMSGNVILIETALSYLGMGVQPPTPSWGNMLTKSAQYLYKAPFLVFIPGFFIFITVLAINLMGNGLRDALDPRLKQ
ncbi:MAG: ABC transporter permease [Anaerolineae bacterium]